MMDSANKIRKDYRLDPVLVKWLEKKARDLERPETWILEWCIREQAKNEVPRKNINER